jgi:hypothetical protein
MKQAEGARDTHSLEHGGTNQDTEIGAGERHSLPSECGEGQLRTHKEKRARKGHSLPEEHTGKDKSDTEREEVSKGHSLPRECAGKDKSEQRKKLRARAMSA